VLLPFASKIWSKPFVSAAITVTLVAAVPALARVGVTSQTDGDPVGKPPTQAERVLRVGIDIQAHEVITTKADDRAHLVFLDGTSLTVAPNAQLVIDKFVYDPNSKKGDLAISVTTGVFRLVGGKISKTTPIIINTPSASIGVRGGIALFEVVANETKAHFLYGISMAVSASGRTEIATRAGSQIFTRLGGAPGAPALIPRGATAQALAALEGHRKNTGGAADEAAKKSGFADKNSGEGLGLSQGTLGGFSRDNQAVEAVNNADLQRQGLGATTPTTFGGATMSFSGPTSPSLGPPAGPSIGGPLPGPISNPPPPTVQPPPTVPPPPTVHSRAVPAIGWGNNGFVPATPANGRK